MNKYFLHIDKPCTEGWDKMTPASQGRFCGSCQKTVFDFTNATDNDIIKHIEKMKGNMFCGQFEEGQLNRWMEKTSLETSNPSLYKYLLSFLLLTAGQNAVAQEVKAKQENVVHLSNGDSALMAQALRAEMLDKSCIKIDSNAGVFENRRIRMGGVRTLTGNKEPLLIVDGKKVKLGTLSEIIPDEVKDVKVLKSLESTSIYGPDGVNGAIIITTKTSVKQKNNKSTTTNK
jgi:hypothetical protein